MSKKQKNNGSNSILELVRNNSVPLMFIIICAVCIPISGFSPGYLLNEIMTRLGQECLPDPEPADSHYGRHGAELWYDAGRHGW